MGELSIEEKALAYDEALRRARDYYEDKNCFEYLKGVLEHIFCELKEPDDEEIRKTLFETFSNFNAAGTFWSDILRISKDNVLAWLEKQGKKPKKMSIWKHWTGGIAGNREGEQIFLIKIGNIYSISSCLGHECDYIELSELDKLMREGKQGKQKPADNIEPKWTEEDEKILMHVIQDVELLLGDEDERFEDERRQSLVWLKLLKQRMEEQQ